MGTAPSRKQSFPESKAFSGKKKKMTDFKKGPAMMTRSMQKEKERRRNPFDLVESLPSLSRALIQTINLRKSAQGLSVTQLKDALGAKGYDVGRPYPSIKRQLRSLASKGALMRMTDKVGSSFFVIRKQPGKDVAASTASEGCEKTVRSKKTGAERTHSQHASAKRTGVAVRTKSSLLRALEVSRKVGRPSRKQKPNRGPAREKPPAQLLRQSSSTKTLQRSTRKAVSTVKRPSGAATKTVLSTKRRRYSRRKSTSSRKRYPRSTAANGVQRSGRPVRQDIPKGSKCFRDGVTVAAKRLGSPSRRTAYKVKASKYFRRKTPPAGKIEKRSRRKASFPPRGPNSRIVPSTRRPRRI